MGKKIVLAVFGGIALFGLALALVGFALGGRPGSVGVDNDKLVYYADNESIPFANAPSWLQGWRGRIYNIFGTGYRYGESNHHATSLVAAAPDAPTAPAAPDMPAPFAANELKKVSIDLSAGYLHIVSGSEPGLTVDGTMEYTSNYVNGEWTIQAHHSNISSRSGGRRFWRNGEDITTTFTLVLPSQFDKLEISLNMGEATISGLSLDKLECHLDAGSMTFSNISAAEADLSVSAGNITATGFDAGSCDLTCDAGNISLQGNITTALDAECGAGYIEVRMPTPADYGWEAEVGLGNASINGQGAAGIAGKSSGGNPNARPFFELECGVGSIEIIFT